MRRGARGVEGTDGIFMIGWWYDFNTVADMHRYSGTACKIDFELVECRVS